jgi:starch synthase
MGCGTAVVASAVGGIKEVVVQDETGALVAYEGDGHGNPLDPAQFDLDLAAQVNRIATDSALARAMGEAGRQRVLDKFSWQQVAAQTVDLYREVLEG